MSDQCLQYKEDYEKLLALKQEFDVALVSGNKTRDYGEALRLKTELEKVLRNLELDLKFKVWKTIELGTGLKTADDFIRALEEGGREISIGAEIIMKQPEFTALSEKTKFELVTTSVADLGFSKVVTTEEIYKRAQEMGLELCSPEVGPQLCLQYKDQPMNEWLRIAMKPIKAHDGDSIFCVERDNGDLWLRAENGKKYYFWNEKRRWVFARRK